MKLQLETLVPLLMTISLMVWAWKPYPAVSEIAGTEVAAPKKFLYVAVPGVRNYLEYGGHGILVYDIDAGHKLIKRIPTHGLKKDGTPSNVKGVAVSTATNCIYISTLEALQCVDLSTEKLVWEK